MKTASIIVITALITGGLIGGGTYYLVNTNTTKEKADLQKQITDLNTRISKAESDLAAAQTTSNSIGFSSNDQTASWKTYSNTTYKLSFKYPQDWKVETGQPYSSNEVVDKIDFSANVSDTNNTHSYLYLEAKNFNGTATDYFNELKRGDAEVKAQGGPTHNFGTSTSVTVGSNTWLKIASVENLAAIQDWYITKSNNIILVAKILKKPGEGPVTDISAFTQKAQQSLNTLTFTK